MDAGADDGPLFEDRWVLPLGEVGEARLAISAMVPFCSCGEEDVTPRSRWLPESEFDSDKRWLCKVFCDMLGPMEREELWEEVLWEELREEEWEEGGDNE